MVAGSSVPCVSRPLPPPGTRGSRPLPAPQPPSGVRRRPWHPPPRPSLRPLVSPPPRVPPPRLGSRGQCVSRAQGCSLDTGGGGVARSAGPWPYVWVCVWEGGGEGGAGCLGEAGFAAPVTPLLLLPHHPLSGEGLRTDF